MAVGPDDADAGVEETREVYEGDVGVEEEAEEVREGGERDTVVGPGAVVVHTGDAAGAVAAVVGSGRFKSLAFLAEAFILVWLLVVFVLLLLVRGGGEDEAAWVDCAGFVVCPPEAEKESVESYILSKGERSGT